MTVNFAGHLYNDAGTAISGASVKLLETGTTTQEGSTVTTDSNGAWAFTEADQDRYDVEITSGSSVRRIRWDDQISLKELDVRNNTGATTPAATLTNITDAVANQVAVFSGANATRADNDEIYLSFKLADSAGNLDEFARMTAVATDVTSGSEDGQIEFDVIKAGTLTKVWTITSSTGAAMSFDMNVDALTIGSGADTDVSLTFDANSADGVITWMEDEDYFKFSDDILMNSTERINLGDTGTYIYQSADGQLDIISDTELGITAPTVDIDASTEVNISTDLKVGDDLSLTSDSSVFNMGAGNDFTITHDGTTGATLAGTPITVNSTGALTLDSSTDITLDADGADVFLKDGGTLFGTLTNSSGELVIKSSSSGTTAITMAGANVTVAGDLTISGDDLTMGTNTDTYILVADGTNYNPVAVSGDVTIANNGAVTAAAAQTNINSLLATDIKIGEDDQTKIDFEDANTINFYANNAKEVVLAENSISPGTSDGTALGTTSLMWSDLFLASGSVINFNNGDVTLTHSSNTLTAAGGTVATAALTTSTIVASGIIKTDDATDATSTTDGSLQADGGLSVVKDAVFGNDVKLLSDSAVLAFGADGDATLTHTNDTGITLNSTNKLMFNDASQFIQGSSATVISIGATDEIDLTATAVDLNGTLDVSGTATFGTGTVYINDSANGNMTTGLTINQGAADNEALALKSSDIAHGYSGQETDTWFSISKVSATEGGARINVLSEVTNALWLVAYGDTDNTTKSTSASAYTAFDHYKDVGTPGSDANLMVIQSGGSTKFIFDAEGSGHADVEWVAFDSYNDLALMDAVQTVAQGRMTPERYGDNPLYYHREYLESTGIIGKDSWHDEDGTPRQMVNFTKLSMLHHGAILQIGDTIKSTEDRLLALEVENRELKALIGGN
jgi:hypothetical protein